MLQGGIGTSMTKRCFAVGASIRGSGEPGRCPSGSSSARIWCPWPAVAKWAPDGKTIAFVMLVPDSTPGAFLSQATRGREVTPAAFVTTCTTARTNRVHAASFTHLFLVPPTRDRAG